MFDDCREAYGFESHPLRQPTLKLRLAGQLQKYCGMRALSRPWEGNWFGAPEGEGGTSEASEHIPLSRRSR